MLSNHRATPISIVVCAMMLSAVTIHAGEEKITRKDLPHEVLSAFEKTYPKASIKGLSREEEGGRVFYEIESLDGKTSRDILYAADGKAAEIEEAVAVRQLPAAVKAAASKEYPKGKIVKAEKVIRESVVEYEIHISVGKAKHEMVVEPAGKVVKHEKEEADEGKEDDSKN